MVVCSHTSQTSYGKYALQLHVVWQTLVFELPLCISIRQLVLSCRHSHIVFNMTRHLLNLQCNCKVATRNCRGDSSRTLVMACMCMHIYAHMITHIHCVCPPRTCSHSLSIQPGCRGGLKLPLRDISRQRVFHQILRVLCEYFCHARHQMILHPHHSEFVPVLVKIGVSEACQ